MMRKLFTALLISGLIVELGCSNGKSSVPPTHSQAMSDQQSEAYYWAIVEASDLPSTTSFESSLTAVWLRLLLIFESHQSELETKGINAFEMWPYCRTIALSIEEFHDLFDAKSPEEAGRVVGSIISRSKMFDLELMTATLDERRFKSARSKKCKQYSRELNEAQEAYGAPLIK